MFSGANAAVVAAVEGVRDMVETTARALHDPVEAGHGTGADTAEGAAGASCFPSYVRQHPWLVTGGILLLGLIALVVAGRARR